MKYFVVKVLESVFLALVPSRLFSARVPVYVCLLHTQRSSPSDFGAKSPYGPPPPFSLLQTRGGGGVLEQGSDRGIERRRRRAAAARELNQREVSLIAAAHLLMELMKNGSEANALR